MAVVSSATQSMGDSVMPQQAIRVLLTWLGEDVERDGLKDTPKRVVKAFTEMTAGYRQDPEEILATTFDVAYDEMVALKGIRFTSLCEHHMLPFVGEAHVGYIPRERVVGLSKMVRLVECFAKRLQVQERMTKQIAEAMQNCLDPLGVGVIVQAQHSCMGCRGVRQPDAEMRTSAMFGALRDEPETRAEFLRLVS